MSVADAPTNPETQVAVKADAEKTTAEVFKWSEWVHVGPGADECQERQTGRCTVEEHFHAWVRLPNPFQVRDIVDKAKAAQARKLRELRDPESDASIILDDELAGLFDLDETQAKAILADELMAAEYTENRLKAIREVDSQEDEDAEPPDDDTDWDRPKRWGHIDQDMEELDRQRALPEDQQDTTAVEALRQRADAYHEEIESALKEIEDERRSALNARSLKDLMKLVRRDRVEVVGTEVYLHTYSTWQWFVCTYKPRLKGTPNERVWRDLNQMKYEAPTDVISTLRSVFDGLEQAMRSRRVGKGF